ncbi:MAG: hypothetical protein FJ100_07495 [Deltaproteobacteria bacterium]|nr:hypothetical protein [Deltaproteobacteria bacterium]
MNHTLVLAACATVALAACVKMPDDGAFAFQTAAERLDAAADVAVQGETADGQGDAIDGQGDAIDGQGDAIDSQGDAIDSQGDAIDSQGDAHR